jgi:radical SAM superfamily enzyme YgiQ (UPF0313 family)
VVVQRIQSDMNKIALAIPPPDPEFHELGNDTIWGYWQPLGLLAIATYLERAQPGLSILILDEQVKTREQITEAVKEFRPHILGVAPSLSNYQNSLSLARLGKELGAKVVFGGPHATWLGPEILARRREVDYVVVEEGEEAMTALVRELPEEEIPNLVWRREDGRVLCNRVQLPDLDSLPAPDLSLLPDRELYFKEYLNNQVRRKVRQPYSRPMAIVAQKGCQWREKSRGGCIFCSCISPRWRGKNPGMVWQDVALNAAEFGVDSLLFGEDDFAASPEWFGTFYHQRPRELKVGIRFIQARADSLTEERISQLADMGCFEVLLGIESASDSCLQAMRKGVSLKRTLEAIELLEKYRIKILPSFVIGAPGETDETLQRTLAMALEMKQRGTDYFRVFPFCPGPGSISWQMMVEKSAEFREKFTGTDILDYKEMIRLWVENFCQTSVRSIVETIHWIHALNLAI